jgi:hypothetical protein
MNNYRIRIAAKVFFFLLFSLHLKAVVYTYNATITLSAPSTITHLNAEWEYFWNLTGAPTFSVQTGDIVQGTISFSGNQALQFLGPASSAAIYLEFRAVSGSGPLTSVSTTTLNGVAGDLTSQNPMSASSSSGGLSFFPGFAFVFTPTAASFNGFSYSGTMTSGGGNYMPYEVGAFNTDDVPGAISVIPEPSVCGLMGLGLTLILLMRKLPNTTLEPQ